MHPSVEMPSSLDFSRWLYLAFAPSSNKRHHHHHHLPDCNTSQPKELLGGGQIRLIACIGMEHQAAEGDHLLVLRVNTLATYHRPSVKGVFLSPHTASIHQGIRGRPTPVRVDFLLLGAHSCGFLRIEVEFLWSEG